MRAALHSRLLELAGERQRHQRREHEEEAAALRAELAAHKMRGPWGLTRAGLAALLGGNLEVDELTDAGAARRVRVTLLSDHKVLRLGDVEVAPSDILIIARRADQDHATLSLAVRGGGGSALCLRTAGPAEAEQLAAALQALRVLPLVS